MPTSFSAAFNDIVQMPKAAILLFAASAASMILAFIVEYGFHHEPCELCLLQRVPFVLVILMAGLACLRPMRPYAWILLGLCGLALLTGSGVAIFHTGVERHWWLGTSGCTIRPLHGSSVEDLRTELLHMAVARCDQISVTFLGLTMANYNVPFSLALALFAFAAARRARP